MGCGKSSVGRELSKLLCCRFADLDAEIEERCGCTVADIFAECGEAEFRRIEKETLKDILETGGRVLEIPKTPALPTVGHPQAGGGKMPIPAISLSLLSCKNMKKYIYILSVVLLASSCVKDLDTMPLNSTDPISEYVYGTDEDAYVSGLARL